MVYFTMFWDHRGREVFIGADGAITRDATQAHMFNTGGAAVAAFMQIPAGMKSRKWPGCKVRTRRV